MNEMIYHCNINKYRIRYYLRKRFGIEIEERLLQFFNVEIPELDIIAEGVLR